MINNKNYNFFIEIFVSWFLRLVSPLGLYTKFLYAQVKALFSELNFFLLLYLLPFNIPVIKYTINNIINLNIYKTIGGFETKCICLKDKLPYTLY